MVENQAENSETRLNSHLRSRRGGGLRILFVDDNLDIRSLLIFLLGRHIRFEAVEASGGEEAIKLLEKGEIFDAIVSDLHMPLGSGLDLYQHIRSNHIKTKVVIVSGDLPSDHAKLLQDPNLTYIQKPFAEEEISTLLTALGETDPAVPADYAPVSLQFLLRVRQIDPPLFVRINENKFVRLTSGPTEFKREDFDRYKYRGLRELHIESFLLDSLIDSFAKRAFSRDAWVEASSRNLEHIRLNTELVRSVAAQLGWSEDVVENVVSSARKALHIIRGRSSLETIYAHFKTTERWGAADHAILVLTISAGLAMTMGHTDQESLQKLSFVSLLHDLSLTPEQYKLKTTLMAQALSVQDNFPPKELTEIINHPVRAVEVAKNLLFCPEDAEAIIFQHHERPHGDGFPMGKKADELSLLSSVFIFAEDLTHLYFESRGRFDMKQFLRSRENRYDRGHFQVIFRTFKKCLEAKTQIAS